MPTAQHTQPNFDKQNGLVPAIIQHHSTQQVLMLGYLNAQSWQQTLQTNKITFYSRSRQALWVKGETSGNYLHLIDYRLDCDADTVLIWAKPDGPTCHTGANTCFEALDPQPTGAAFLSFLQHQVIATRKKTDPEQSYTARMFKKGINKLAQKVGEEAVELVIEAKDNNKDLFLNEAADLVFHYLMLLEAKGHSIEEVVEILRQRHQ